jgi:hypothetical protein
MYRKPVIHVKETCNTCKGNLHVLQVSYTCITGFLYMYYRFPIHVLQVSFTCITGFLYMYYRFPLHDMYRKPVIHVKETCNTCKGNL